MRSCSCFPYNVRNRVIYLAHDVMNQYPPKKAIHSLAPPICFGGSRTKNARARVSTALLDFNLKLAFFASYVVSASFPTSHKQPLVFTQHHPSKERQQFWAKRPHGYPFAAMARGAAIQDFLVRKVCKISAKNIEVGIRNRPRSSIQQYVVLLCLPSK